MVKVFTSAVVIIPPQEIWNPIQKIRKKYDRQINRWMPHITLLYPFRPASEFDDLENKFSRVCSNINNFKIKLETFRYFSQKKSNFTIWIAPEPRNLIIELQSKLLEIVPDCNDVNLHKKGFIPHLSVGQFNGNKKVLFDLIDYLQQEWNQIAFNLNSIEFISRENHKSSRFQIQKQILFNHYK
ncbi:MAG: 2'-5' RNA ligase family protein [Candidatus Hodarchaeota archaeon]